MPTYIHRFLNKIVQTGWSESGSGGWNGRSGVEGELRWTASLTAYNRGTDNEEEILKAMGYAVKDLYLISELPETFPAEVVFVEVCEITDELLSQVGISV